MPDRGEVWFVNFDPSVGGEIQKPRPAIVVSNNSANRGLNRVQVVPLTSNVARLYPSEAYVTLRGQQHKALASQLTTVSKQRLLSKVERLSVPELVAVDDAIRVQLQL